MSDHIHKIILVRSCRKFNICIKWNIPSRFMPIGSSHLTQMVKKGTFRTPEWDVKNEKNNN